MEVQRMRDKNMWKMLRGKNCKIVLGDGESVVIYVGKVIDANDSFVVEKDRFGRIHFLNTSTIERISEQPELKEIEANAPKQEA